MVLSASALGPATSTAAIGRLLFAAVTQPDQSGSTWRRPGQFGDLVGQLEPGNASARKSRRMSRILRYRARSARGCRCRERLAKFVKDVSN